MDYKEAFLNDSQLLQVLATSKSAIAVHVTEQMNIQFASDAMIAIWGKDRSVIGKPLEEALPELVGQPFLSMFQKVLHEGITIDGTDTPAQLEVDGEIKTFYFDFEYKAIKDENGIPFCVLHTATDITERYLGIQREQNLTEELTASNEELFATNEELTASNEELRQSQESMQEIYEELAEKDARFRNMVKQAPVSMCIIRAHDLYITDVNDSYLELVGKTREQMEGRTIWEAVPEAAAAYAPVMNEVIRSGVAFVADEHELTLVRNGVPEQVFVDFVYEPVKSEGYTEAIMVLGIDVSEKVKARKSIEDVEERIRLAVEAAEIGTFDLNLKDNVMVTSKRFNNIFGFDEQVDWNKFVSVIHPDDRGKRSAAHDLALKTGKMFYEARVIYSDNSVHWIRVQGQVYYDDNKEPVRILGTLLDITQFKRLQQQKDDFISIASHELKTPITSLKASLQLLDRMKNDPAPKVLPRLVEQSNRSMQKISTLVEDLLNVSRANETQLKLNKTTFTLSEMLDNCCSHIRVAGKYSLNITGDKELQIIADEHAIDQVVVNLVNNAVKYAPESLQIEMHIEKQGEMAKISISDKGPGIPAEKIPQLFERYYQIDPSGYQNSGLGLGLYISNEIIKKHGGAMGVDSALGKGSTFWFTLPL